MAIMTGRSMDHCNKTDKFFVLVRDPFLDLKYPLLNIPGDFVFHNFLKTGSYTMRYVLVNGLLPTELC